MKRLSIKARLTLWLTLLIALLSLLLLIFMLSVSQQVTTHTAMSQLAQTVKQNLPYISMAKGKLSLSKDFSFYQNGVSILLYSKDEALLAGQLPVSFQAKEPFQNGLARTVLSEEGSYLALDLWLPSDWENGVWVRGLLEIPSGSQTAFNLLLIALITLPAFMALTALGSYRIVKKAFRPLDSIASTAAAIEEARDLSRRIALPPGKDEFSRLADTFDKLFERLERSFEAEKQFTGDASHELRTPLAVIKSACEYGLKYDETPSEHRETLEMISRQTLKMSDLITQLLNMTRMEQGTEQFHPEPLRLKEWIPSVLEQYGFDPDRITLSLPEELSLQADPALLSRLLINLADNAFKYGKPGGHVWISAVQSQKEILLQVKDDGIGIAPKEQEKVWKRFYQTDPSRSSQGGAGLGLSMVQKIAELHGGYMTLNSIPDIGSSFTLHLPRSEKTSPKACQ